MVMRIHYDAYPVENFLSKWGLSIFAAAGDGKEVDSSSTFVSRIVPEPVSDYAGQLRLPSVKPKQDSLGLPSAAQFSRVLV